MSEAAGDGTVSSETPTYSVRVTSDELRAMKEVLYQFCVCQSLAVDSAAQNRIGLGELPSRRTLLTLTAVGAMATGVLLAMTTSNDVLARIFLGSLTAFFCVFFLAQLVFGRDAIRATIRKRFIDPMIRGTVNISMARSIKRAPYSVVFRFFEASYATSSPKLKIDRTILGDDISIAYKSESVFCLFQRKSSQRWKSIIYAPEPNQRDIVEAFLKANHIEVRELDVPPQA